MGGDSATIPGGTPPDPVICCKIVIRRHDGASSPTGAAGAGAVTAHAEAMRRAIALRHGWHWLTVNGGILAIAMVVAAVDHLTLAATTSAVASALSSTLVLYVLVFSACALNLRGRPQRFVESPSKRSPSRASRPIAWLSIVSHPLGCAFERYAHAFLVASSVASVALPGQWEEPAAVIEPNATTLLSAAPWPIGAALNLSEGPGEGRAAFDGSLATLITALVAAVAWWVCFAARLLVFEVVYDGFFYIAHRAVHALPSLYVAVHKLHHAHTHDVRLLSSLQVRQEQQGGW